MFLCVVYLNLVYLNATSVRERLFCNVTCYWNVWNLNTQLKGYFKKHTLQKSILSVFFRNSTVKQLKRNVTRQKRHSLFHKQINKGKHMEHMWLEYLYCSLKHMQISVMHMRRRIVSENKLYRETHHALVLHIQCRKCINSVCIRMTLAPPCCDRRNYDAIIPITIWQYDRRSSVQSHASLAWLTPIVHRPRHDMAVSSRDTVRSEKCVIVRCAWILIPKIITLYK